MQLVIIRGRSGSGKSTALHVLEDIGFTCIDNLPAFLLPSLAEKISQFKVTNYAVCIDARNHHRDLQKLPSHFFRRVALLCYLPYQHAGLLHL